MMPKRLSLWALMTFASSLALAQDAIQDSAEDDTSPSQLPAGETSDGAREEAGESVASASSAEATNGAPKALVGMSILGNEEAPKSLVIVPWKSSEIGDGLGVSNSVDDLARPVDRDVFLREIRYYELRSRSTD